MDMTRRSFLALTGFSALALAGCSVAPQQPPQESNTSQPAPKEDAKQSETTDKTDSTFEKPRTLEEQGKDHPDAPVTANIGDKIPVQTGYGDLEIAVDGLVTSKEMNRRYKEIKEINDEQQVGILLLVVKNVSFKFALEPEDHSVPLTYKGFVKLEDEDGISLAESNSAYDYNKYQGAAGGWIHDLDTGQAKRIAIFFPIDKTMTKATVRVGKVQVPVDVK